MQSWFEGDFDGFKKTHGNAYFCNVLAYLTRQHEHKKNKTCQGIPGVHEPHTFQGNITLAHPYGAERHDILKDLLVPHTSSDGRIRVDIFVVEKEFVDIRKKMIADGACRFLCPPANALWGSKPGNLADIRDIYSVTIKGKVNLEKLQVELIFQGLTNDQVLSEVRKIFPGRATIATVRFYRSRLRNDRSAKFDQLRAGRVVPLPRGRDSPDVERAIANDRNSETSGWWQRLVRRAPHISN
jgi:hypothetical protein